jgi:SpoVK/Ycf46/Vps4 family AAA+-type ATPase
LETLARLWQRDSLLLPLALYVDAHDVDKGTGTDGILGRLTRFVLRTGGLVVVDSRDGAASSFDHALTVEVDKPTPAEQRAVWQAALGEEALGEDSGDIPARLAGQFNLNQDGVASIVALARQSESSASLEDRLWQQCLAKTRPGMDRLAEKLDAKATWDDIVLPEQEASLLRQIAAQVQVRSRVYDDWGFRARMNRGLGISALFAGDSGTGKTMAAEVLANALQLDLYRIDLSAVVSKYIGETEKNLRQVFDAAEDGGAILFFDEADAIFGKRSEVKDSHDRYANIEINYLLQRMEAYRGLAILASNMKSALDSAFMRRLRFIVNFPFPSAADRKRIWERVFPTETKTDGLDHDRLARFTLTGGSIHNIALNSAFLAAQGGDKVTMPLIFEAARTEFRKLDRPINEADFRLVKAVEHRA